MAYPTGYSRYQEVTIDKDEVDADLTDFPVYVDLSDLVKVGDDLFDTCRSDGGDIRITKSDGTTELPREVVAIDTSAKTGELHFKYTGTLSSTIDTVIRIYYNGTDTEPAIDATYGAENVWNSNYKAVYHLKNTSGGELDSTSNDNDLSDNETVGSAVGKLGNARDFEHDNGEFLNITDNASLDFNNADFTISLWVNPETARDWGGITKATAFNETKANYYLTFNTGLGGMLLGVGNGSSRDCINVGTITTGTWKHYVGRFTASSGELAIFENTTKNSKTTAINPASNAGDFNLGAFAGSAQLDGKMDEVRIVAAALADNWISTEYSNQNAPSTFYATGDEEGTPSGPANLKSINGLAKASIKSRNGLAIGSIKSINGLS